MRTVEYAGIGFAVFLVIVIVVTVLATLHGGSTHGKGDDDSGWASRDSGDSSPFSCAGGSSSGDSSCGSSSSSCGGIGED